MEKRSTNCEVSFRHSLVSKSWCYFWMDTALLKMPLQILKMTWSKHLKQDMKLRHCETNWTVLKLFKSLDVDLIQVVGLMNSPGECLISLRDRYEELELDARNFCGNTDYKSTTGRPRKRNKLWCKPNISHRGSCFFSQRNIQMWNFLYHFRAVACCLTTQGSIPSSV